jgi:hypothetical protein
MNKKIDEGGYLEFITKFFPKHFPSLRAKFPSQIEWSMLNAPYGVRRPYEMSVEDFDDFRLVEHEWLLDNGYIAKDAIRPSFVNMVYGITIIPLPDVSIDSVIPLDDRTTIINVTALNDNVPHSYSVVGNIDFTNRKLGIYSNGN